MHMEIISIQTTTMHYTILTFFIITTQHRTQHRTQQMHHYMHVMHLIPTFIILQTYHLREIQSFIHPWPFHNYWETTHELRNHSCIQSHTIWHVTTMILTCDHRKWPQHQHNINTTSTQQTHHHQHVMHIIPTFFILETYHLREIQSFIHPWPFHNYWETTHQLRNHS